ncbi:GAP family protein [Zhihengliuella alba]|uniref:GAP family protein n=1 Tax=Zhihengliuella alba TaxID=547018 RepID=A0ABP7DZN9_9MICC
MDSLDQLIGAGAAGSPLMLLGVLAVLALIDSTSFGTLLIPVWLLMAPGRLRVGRIVLYLLTVAGAYAVVGLVLLATLSLFGDALLRAFESVGDSAPYLWAQLAAAVLLIWLSSRMDPLTEWGRKRKRERDAAKDGPGRLQRFRARAVGGVDDGGGAGDGRGQAAARREGSGALVGLALAAVAIEIATLLPYLAGIGLVAAQGPAGPASSAYILFYCAVMILPAALLLLLRATAGPRTDRLLGRFEAFLSRHANGTGALVLFLIGLFLGLNALDGLGITG